MVQFQPLCGRIPCRPWRISQGLRGWSWAPSAPQEEENQSKGVNFGRDGGVTPPDALGVEAEPVPLI